MNHESEHREHFLWHERPVGKGLRIAGRVVVGIAAASVFALVFGYLVMILWNWLMPVIFRLPAIGYWQAFGIVILAKLVFGSIGGHGNGRHPRSRRARQTTDFDWEAFFEKVRGTAESENWKDFFNPHRWKHYRDFWRDEGKQAFERYMAGREETGENGDFGATSRNAGKGPSARKRSVKKPKTDTGG
jgi:hypothetical protein